MTLPALMSNCLTSQAVWMDSSHGFPVFAMALRIVSSFLMQGNQNNLVRLAGGDEPMIESPDYRVEAYGR
jgi:hypothetical protein